jgi:hypothetical protein
VTGDPADILFSGTLSCREILGSTGRDAKVEVEPDWKADWQEVPSLGNMIYDPNPTFPPCIWVYL